LRNFLAKKTGVRNGNAREKVAVKDTTGDVRLTIKPMEV